MSSFLPPPRYEKKFFGRVQNFYVHFPTENMSILTFSDGYSWIRTEGGVRKLLMYGNQFI